MRRVCCAAFASLLALDLVACANVWGFADLTSEDRDGGPTPDASSGDSTIDSSDGTTGGQADASGSDVSPDVVLNGSGCNLANSSICRGICPGNASPCGCLPDPSAQTSYCSVVGNGTQGASCATDSDCAPGYGCLTTRGGICSHWCKPSTTCPGTTRCQGSPTVTLGTTHYNYCY